MRFTLLSFASVASLFCAATVSSAALLNLDQLQIFDQWMHSCKWEKDPSKFQECITAGPPQFEKRGAVDAINEWVHNCKHERDPTKFLECIENPPILGL
ncbi:hypothetical protein DL96DRAFT_1715448 [Flagelloscypha sp. PMI_526]|nr:hypothetical protein DL96DRAFT_1715448 [Flagelloscypha sp. PMI_526]